MLCAQDLRKLFLILDSFDSPNRAGSAERQLRQLLPGRLYGKARTFMRARAYELIDSGGYSFAWQSQYSGPN